MGNEHQQAGVVGAILESVHHISQLLSDHRTANARLSFQVIKRLDSVFRQDLHQICIKLPGPYLPLNSFLTLNKFLNLSEIQSLHL